VASFRSYEQQIRDVRACNDEHDADGRCQHPEHIANVAHHARLQWPELGRNVRGLEHLSADS
jgi:hypothetical protein